MAAKLKIEKRGGVNWCRGKLAMSVQLYWKRVIFSDETQVVVGHDMRVHVWRKADEIWRPECVGLRGGPCVAVMFWGCITEMANSDNLIHFLSSTGQLCERHDMEHYHLERCTHRSEIF
jgi:hypothetical protein